MPLLTRLLRGSINEADPMQAGLQVDFEQREADPSKYTISQNIHPANEEIDGGNDGNGAPYDGTQMAGMPGGGGMGAMGMPEQPPGDEEMQPIQPGMQDPNQQQQMMPMQQEGFMKDHIDIFLDSLLEGIEDLQEAPPDWVTRNNPARNYTGYDGPQQAPASVAAGGQQAVQKWQNDTMAARGGQVGGGQVGGDFGGGGRTGGGSRTGGIARPQGGRGPAGVPDENIRAMQNNLASKGFDVGKSGADGIMGKDTRAAMQAAKGKGFDFSPGGGLTYQPKFSPNGIQQNTAGPGTGDREKDLTPATATQPAGAAGQRGGFSAPGFIPIAPPAFNGAQAGQQLSGRGQQIMNPGGQQTPGFGQRGSNMLNPGNGPTAARSAGVTTPGVTPNGAPAPGAAPQAANSNVGVNRGAQLLDPAKNGTIDPNAPRANAGRVGQILGQGAEEEGGGIMRGIGNAARGAGNMLGRAGAAVGDAASGAANLASRGVSAAGDLLPGAARAALPRVAGFAANPLVGGVVGAVMPSPTSKADWSGKAGTPYTPPPGWDKPAPGMAGSQPSPGVRGAPQFQPQQPRTTITGAGAGSPPPQQPPTGAPQQIASVQSNSTPPPPPTKTEESVMSWKDYMSLFEVDEKKMSRF